MSELTSLPLTVLGYEGPMLKAYLAALRHAGYQPERLVLMVSANDVATGKPIGRWLPKALRLPLAERMQDLRLNHWPRQIRQSHPALFQLMSETIAGSMNLPMSVFDVITGPTNYAQFCERVEKILVTGLKDPMLQAHLARHAPAAILFTGGGIVPATLLSTPELRFIHVHPGHLPYVRGADGLLWSTLVRGSPGASSFYMAPGIDTGDVIRAASFEALTFAMPPDKRPDSQTLYRALFTFYDPVIRAALLVQTLENGGDPFSLPADVQNQDEGETYRFMSQPMRKRALEMLFPAS